MHPTPPETPQPHNSMYAHTDNVSSFDNSSSHSIIRLVGMPPPGVVDASHSLAPGLASSEESAAFNRIAFPELLEDEDPITKVVDTLDATNEDPFTLETFEELVRLHMEKQKDFIIARVITESNDGRLYYNYYAAHHINKVLFRTQPEEGLLHRMKAKNPLNNMHVVGDVHYYIIKTLDSSMNPLVATKQDYAEPDRHQGLTPLKTMSVKEDPMLPQQEHQKPQPSSSSSAQKVLERSNSSASIRYVPGLALEGKQESERHHHRHRVSILSDAILTDRCPKALLDGAKLSREELISSASKSAPCRLCSSVPAEQRTQTTVTSPKLVLLREELSTPQPPKGPLVFTAHYYATDDDFLMRRFIREYFKKSAINTEDIFLFTLYGSSQLGGEGTFSSPLVSDPTDPNARAESVEDAVRNYLQREMTPAESDDTVVDRTSTLRHRTSVSSSLSRRLRNMFSAAFDRPPTPASPATPADQHILLSPGNQNETPPGEQSAELPRRSNSPAAFMEYMRQLFRVRPHLAEMGMRTPSVDRQDDPNHLNHLTLDMSSEDEQEQHEGDNQRLIQKIRIVQISLFLLFLSGILSIFVDPSVRVWSLMVWFLLVLLLNIFYVVLRKQAYFRQQQE